MHRRISIAAGVVVAVAIAALIVIGPRTGSAENLRNTLQAYGPWAVAISAGLMIAQSTVAPLPTNVIAITNAMVFGPIWGGLLSWGSMVTGASLCFLLSKTFGKPFAEKVAGNSIQGAERFFRKFGLQAMFLLRMLPFVPFDAINYVAPVVGVPFSRFLLATAVGIVPSIFLYSYLGPFIARIYWWVLIGLLSLSLGAIIFAAKALRRCETIPLSPSPPFASSEKISDPIS